jgi:crotonobetainyl-CoA:carnitine CoA-transferase CaiB-like acyl-CoA transferase
MAQPDFSQGPLSGVRVLDLSRVIAGPYCTRVLADLGAEVIKVEPPEGDQSREIAIRSDRGHSALYTFANVGKRCIAIDFSAEGAVELVLALVGVCDAVVENFRPGVLDRRGLGWDAIHAANPRAVLLSLNGYGSDSIWSHRRAYAPILHAVTGILRDQAAYTGQPVAQLNEAHTDTTTSLHGAVALLAALRVAEATGRGQRVEVPMFDATLATYSETGNALLDEADTRRMNPLYDAGPLGAIACAGPEAHVWTSVARTHSELEDPTPPGADIPTKARLRRRALEAWMASQADAAVLEKKLAQAGIASGPVVSLRDALGGELARERGLLVAVADNRGGTRAVVRAPARFSESENRVRGRAPRRGEHNAEVLGSLLGYDAEQVRALEQSGVLSAADPSER